MTLSKPPILSSSDTPWQESFSEIQCYGDHQVNSILTKLIEDPYFTPKLFSLFSASHVLKPTLNHLKQVDTIDALQNWIECHIFPLVELSYKRFSISGLDNLDKHQNYIFISNHRDIVMDPLLLNQALRSNGFSTANCAIGDNLLTHPFANDLALLNRCFKVFRSLKSPRAMLNAMKNQCAYIQYLHFNKHEHIWIAQKEGRAKDNIDKTNPALIKMLGLCKPKENSLEDYLESLNIVPVCFSYEWDPCDTDKAQQLNNQQTDTTYQKDAMDDLIATQKGLKGYKGQIHLHFGMPLKRSQTLTTLNHKTLSEEIDRIIHESYKVYPVNYAAYKKVHGSAYGSCPFDKQEVNKAQIKLEKRLEGYSSDIAKRVYSAYAQVLM